MRVPIQAWATVRENPNLRVGEVFFGVSASGGYAFHCRHVSEVVLYLSNATWHPHGGRCPTWTDATECVCMKGEEA